MPNRSYTHQSHKLSHTLQELQRPRVDITGRISSLFRDTLPGAVCWLDKAVKMVAELDESFEDNFVRKHVIEESQRLESEGVDAASAWKQASYRLFGDPPGAHETAYCKLPITKYPHFQDSALPHL